MKKIILALMLACFGAISYGQSYFTASTMVNNPDIETMKALGVLDKDTSTVEEKIEKQVTKEFVVPPITITGFGFYGNISEKEQQAFQREVTDGFYSVITNYCRYIKECSRPRMLVFKINFYKYSWWISSEGDSEEPDAEFDIEVKGFLVQIEKLKELLKLDLEKVYIPQTINQGSQDRYRTITFSVTLGEWKQIIKNENEGFPE